METDWAVHPSENALRRHGRAKHPRDSSPSGLRMTNLKQLPVWLIWLIWWHALSV